MNPAMKTMSMIRRGDSVAVLQFDSPGSSVNVLSRPFLEDLRAALDEIERSPEIRACVLASAKPGCFVAGADLSEISKVTVPKEAADLSRQGQEILDRIEKSRIPFVAAIDGVALGGGLELVLACHSRVA